MLEEPIVILSMSVKRSTAVEKYKLTAFPPTLPPIDGLVADIIFPVGLDVRESHTWTRPPSHSPDCDVQDHRS